MKSYVSSSSIRGLLLKPLMPAKLLLTLFTELLLNIRTEPGRHPVADPAAGVYGDNEAYSTINYWFIRKIINVVGPAPDDVFYDLGCGMGRVLCMFARKRLAGCVGVEYSLDRYAQCVSNTMSLKGRRSPVEVRHEDAATTDLSDGTLFYLFNPFGPSTLRAVLDNIKRSLVTRPRTIRIVYVNPVCRDVMESCGWLRLYYMYRTMLDLYVTFWTNSADNAGAA